MQQAVREIIFEVFQPMWSSR